MHGDDNDSFGGGGAAKTSKIKYRKLNIGMHYKINSKKSYVVYSGNVKKSSTLEIYVFNLPHYR